MANKNVVRQDVVQITWDVQESPLGKITGEAQKFQSTVGKAVGASENKFNKLTKSVKDTQKQFQTASSGGKKFANVIKDMAKTNLNKVKNGITKVKTGFTNGLTATKKFLSSLKDIDKEKFSKLTQSVNKLTKKIGSGIVTAAKKAAKAIAAIGAAGAVGIFKLTDMASDLSETMNKVDVSFGDSSSIVQEWSKNSIKDMGLAQQTALDMAALFGDMGTGMGIPQKEAANMSMSLTQLGADLASFKNMNIEEVTTALNGVFTGETESLKRLGVVMTQANLEQFAMSKGMKKSIEDMTEAEKVNLRYAYVMEKTANAQGDFARTGGGFANQLRMAKEQLKQIGTTIGGVFIGGFEKALNKVNKFGAELNAKLSEVFADGFQFEDIAKITPMLGPVGTGIQKIADKIKAITSDSEKMSKIKSVFDSIKTAVGSVIGFVGKLASKVTDFVTSSGFLDKVKSVVDGISKAFNFLGDHIDGVMNVITFAATAFGLFTVALNVAKIGIAAYNLVSGIMKAKQAMATGTTLAQAAAQWGLNSALLACPITWIVIAIIALIAIIVVLVKNWDKIKQAAANCWNWIKEAWGQLATWFNTKVVQPIVQFFTGLWDSICNIFGAIGEWINTNVIQPIKNLFLNWFYFVIGIYTYIWEGLCAIFGPIAEWVNVNVIQPVVNWFKNLWQKITIIAQLVWGVICAVWGQISTWVSTNIIQPVVNFFTGLWNKLTEIVNNVWNTICNVWGQISGWVDSNIIQPVSKFFSNLWDGITDAVDSVRDAITGAFQKAWDTVTGIWSGITDFFSGLWDGIKNIVGKIIGKGKEATGAANDTKGGRNRKMANGGFSNGPERILWGEAGPEVIIPLSANKRNRGLSLWQQAGQMLGAQVTPKVSLPNYSPASSVSTSSVSSTENNNYSPQFTLNLSGTVDRTTERTVKHWIKEALEETFDGLGRTNPRLTEV